ncbi:MULTISPECIES: hypothetical protein [unclassified Aliiroseovarius]|uniref:hypothetical protein n=1 Tax=unclassified Aliiroseovarius TaxID=2623558 RepID=UPI001568D9AA|nr:MULTISPECIES: hypothetical protein [unclassified Aliiroseovarius]NRP11527.1 hypothetical protein [Aliiroseovarius sp. xm-d-517]NRP42093.1 hypothetical protein [Aliiroseovarius sp. xm-m-339-2]NRP63100.1 hypothetical protein [Aliiroseovarius sp. xm-a-151]
MQGVQKALHIGSMGFVQARPAGLIAVFQADLAGLFGQLDQPGFEEFHMCLVKRIAGGGDQDGVVPPVAALGVRSKPIGHILGLADIGKWSVFILSDQDVNPGLLRLRPFQTIHELGAGQAQYMTGPVKYFCGQHPIGATINKKEFERPPLAHLS